MPREYRFNYTGGVQSIHLPPGKYKIEAYGAQGGSTYGTGGLGGYSYGELILDKLTTIFICVGQCPSDLTGGYNGGGNGSIEGAWASAYCSPGGGATHVALVDRGELFNYQSNLSDILLVAGAGGGGAQYSIPFPGSDGGGLQAGKTYHNYWSNYSYAEDTQCIPANQVDSGTPRSGISVFPGEFGRGNLLGGGGLFGGSQFSSSNEVFSGQGGSGYLNTAVLENCGSECGNNSGNGYVIITAISIIVNPEDFDRLNSNIYKNIFPEEVIDIGFIEDLKKRVINSYNEIKYINHGFDVHDVVLWHQWTDKQYKDIYRDIYQLCPNLTPISATVSYTNNGYLSGGRVTVRVTVIGGTDPWNRTVNKTLSCTGVYSFTKVADNVYDIVFTQAGVFTLTVTAKSIVFSLPSVTSVSTIIIKNADGTTTSSGAFSGTAFASAWMNTSITPGCYVNSFRFNLKIRSGHGSSSDTMYILGKKSDGSTVIIRDVFNSGNNMKPYPTYSPKTGNLSSVQWSLSGTLTLSDDIRQISFYANSPGHSGCVTGAAIDYSMNLTFDENLYSTDAQGSIAPPTGTKSVSWSIVGTNPSLATQEKIGEEYVRTDLVSTNIQFEYQKAIAKSLVSTHTSTKNGKVMNTRDDEYRIVGIVTAVKNENIFTLMDEGQLDWPYLDFDDTTVLYLSDKNPGKVCHYKEIDNMTYIPIAIYTDGSIIINIMDGTTGAPFAPYDKNQEETQEFEPYTQADLDDIIGILWGGPHED